MKYAAIRRRRDNVLQRLFQRPGVAIAGRDGTLAQSGATGATALHPTTGAVVSAGALISHNLPIPGVGNMPMSFAQGARTNLLLRSQELDNASWTTSGLAVSVAPNAVPAPDGTTTADKLAATAVSNNHYIRQDISKAASSLRYAFSFYAKEAEYRYAIVQFVEGGNGAQCIVDLRGGSIATAGSTFGAGFTFVSATCYSVGGFYRVVVVVDSTTGVSLQSRIGFSPNNNYTAYTGDGTSGIYVWGAQLEQAAFPGVYIPTTSAALTRAADNILWTPPSALSTISGEVVAIAAPYLWSAGAGAAHPTAAFARLTDAAGGVTQLTRGTTDNATRFDAGGSQAASASALAMDNGSLAMRSGKWDASAVSLYRGSTLANQDATLTAPYSACTALSMGSTTAGATHFFGFVGLIYVPGGLTDAERSALARLTAGSITYVG